MEAASRLEGQRSLPLILLAVLLAAAALLAMLFLRRDPLPRVPGKAARQAAAARPSAPPTPPEPIIIADLSADQARASNAAVPFVPGKIVAAKPFVYSGNAADQSAALACLAAAVLYEAGDDKVGQEAVAQVVLNRVRHPAFPKNVCGVVFQGSERRTGCQFTFTCDGALARVPGAAVWARARAVAEKALAGSVVATVGTATHYHADWVVPYWRAGLAKVAEVHTHIFYRWPGWWGERAAFSGGLRGPERLDPRLLAIAGPQPGPPAPDWLPSEGAEGAQPARKSISIEDVPTPALKGSIVRLADTAAHQYVLQLDPSAFPGNWAVVGFTICAAKPDCLVMGWTSEQETPHSLPVLPGANRSMAFMYRKSSVLDLAKPYWDCRRFPRADRTQCMPGT
ncbi:MAG: SleB-like protein [Sphingomonas bacterium]|nr:SleB-like protein [Sphingomonas bacterium]